MPFDPTIALAHGSGITLTKSVPATVYTSDDSFQYGVLIEAPGRVVSTTGSLDTATCVTDTIPPGQNPLGYSSRWPWVGTNVGGEHIFKLWEGTQTGQINVGDVTVGLNLPIADHTVLAYPASCFGGYVDGSYESFCEGGMLTTEVRAPAFSFSQVPTVTCAGSTITYTLTVSNVGGAPTTRAFKVEAELDPEAVYVSGSASDEGTYSDGRILWSIDNILMANGANAMARSFQIAVPFSLNDGDFLTHWYTVTSAEVTPDGGGLTTTQIEKVSAEFTHTAPVCWGETVYFTNTPGSIPAADLTWHFGDGTMVQGEVAVGHQYANPGTYEVSLIVTGTCGSTLQTDVYTSSVSVNAVSASFDVAPSPACVGGMVYFTNTSVLSETAASWLWDFGDGVLDDASWDNAHVYVEPGEYIVTLYVTNTLGCSDRYMAAVSVEEVAASFDVAPSLSCVGETVYFTNTSVLSGTVASWLWDFGDGVFDGMSWDTGHVYAGPGDYIVTLYVTNTLGCSDWYTVSVGVEDVAASFDLSASASCVGEMVYFTNTSVLSGTVASWLWDFGDGTLEDASWDNAHAYTEPGEYIITLYVTNTLGCNDWYMAVINVEGVAASFDLSVSASCIGEMVYFTNTSVLSETAASWLWDFGDGVFDGMSWDTSHVYVAPGEYIVALYVTNTLGCSARYMAAVSVEEVAASFDVAPSLSCVGERVYFTNTSVLSGTVASWLWDFGDGVFEGMSWDTGHVYAGPGEYVVTLNVTNTLGCNDWYTAAVNVEGVAASFTTSSPACIGGAVYFTNTSVLSGAVDSWLWDFGDGALDSDNWDMGHVYADPGEYIATLYVTNTLGCSDWYTVAVGVEDVTASFDVSTDLICAGGTVWFTDTSVITGTVLAYTWDYGEGAPQTGSSLTQTNHTYDLPGEYAVTLHVTTTAGCNDRVTRPITVQNVEASFDSAPALMCVNGTVHFTGTSAFSGTVDTYTWDYGDGTIQSGSDLTMTNHFYTLPGNHVVTLHITNTAGCSDSVTGTVSVQTSNVQFNADPLTCLGQGVSFTNLTVVTPTNSVSSYLWDFGNGDVITDVWAGFLYMGYTSPATYTATLTVTTTAGCVDSQSREVTILPSPVPTFTIGSPVCAGDTTYFTNMTSGSDNAYLWDFGDYTTSSLENPMHTYSTAGVYIVTLTVTNTSGCAISHQEQVNVLPPPAPGFVFSAPACAGQVVAFTNTTVPPANNRYLWDFDDGVTSSLPNPTHSFASAGTYSVTLTVTNAAGCVNSVLHAVTIDTVPVASFTSSSPVCLGEAMTFTNQSMGATSYLWSFGDSVSTPYVNPVHQYAAAGDYTVMLTATSACGIDVTMTMVTVNMSPQPVIECAPTSVNVGETVTFTDTGTGAESWWWDFGDGHTDIGQVVTHAYTVAGIYTAVLTATNSLGCASSAEVNVEVTESHEGNVYLPIILKSYGDEPLLPNLVIDSIDWIINGAVSVAPPTGGQRFHVQVVISNQGPGAALPSSEGIWVDLHLKPSHTPAAGDLWWDLSQSGACPKGGDCYGFAWHITNPLLSGGSVTLRTSDLIDPTYSRWVPTGVPFDPAKHAPIVAFVDAWPAPTGDILESNENDNLSDQLTAAGERETALRAATAGGQARSGPRPRLNSYE